MDLGKGFSKFEALHKPTPNSRPPTLDLGISDPSDEGDSKACASSEQIAQSNAVSYVPPQRKRGGRGPARPMAYTASQYVMSVVQEGLLPHPDTLICADCGRSADAYDHRDYLRPLDVVPVCITCNNLRGAGYPYTNKAATHE